VRKNGGVFCAFASLITLTTGAFDAPEAFEVGPETKGQLPRGKEADGITSPQAKVKPCAYHNPIFVDVDGGFKPNGDSLGYNLPVKKLSVQDVRRLIDQAESSAN
jgi:hypothetical protein